MSSEEKKIQKGISSQRVIFVFLFCLGISLWLGYREFSKSSFSITDLSFNGKTFFFLTLALVFMAMRDLAYMYRIRHLSEGELSWKQAFNVILIWEFASALSPGVVGGSAVAMFILKREKIPLGRSTAIVIITAIFDNLFYILFIPLVFLIVPQELIFSKDIQFIENVDLSLFWIGYSIVSGICFLLFITVFFQPGLLAGIIRFVVRLPFLNKFKESAVQTIADLKTSSQVFKHKPIHFWWRTFLFTAWSWISRFLVVNAVLVAFIQLGIFENFVVLCRQLVIWLVMLITPTPGGSGMAEFLFQQYLGDFIRPVSLALLLAFIWRLLSYYPYLLIGSILVPRWLRKKNA